VADLGEEPGGPSPPPLFWVKKEEITEGRNAGAAGQAKQNRPPSPPHLLAQGLDPPLAFTKENPRERFIIIHNYRTK